MSNETSERKPWGTTRREKRYQRICEKLGWNIRDNCDGSVEICQYSPAGEDFSFTVDRKKFVDDVKFYYDNFDVDEHIEMWVKARDCGVSGIPSVRRLAIDAEEIDSMLQDLAYALGA